MTVRSSSSPTDNAISQIRDSAADGKLVAVIGTGVSLALTNNKNHALSWKGLIENGFEYGATKGKITGAQKASWQTHLDSTDIDDVLGAAEFMGRKLGALAATYMVVGSKMYSRKSIQKKMK